MLEKSISVVRSRERHNNGKGFEFLTPSLYNSVKVFRSVIFIVLFQNLGPVQLKKQVYQRFFSTRDNEAFMSLVQNLCIPFGSFTHTQP